MKRLASALWLLSSACAPPPDDAREATVVNALVRADEVLIRTRPALASGKYARMASSEFAFLRGALPLFRADWEAGRVSRSGFLADTEPVLGLGDPHPENFGLLTDRNDQLALEPNDFDSADRVPYLFDLRRLITGLAVGARLQRGDAGVEMELDALAQTAARAYAEKFIALADGEEPARLTDDRGSLVLQDLFRRGRRDLIARAELDALVTDAPLDGDADAGVPGPRRLTRGVQDPTEPTDALDDVPPEVAASLPEVLAPLGPVRVLDVARHFGSGVASWPRVRYLVLLDGETEAANDDVILEIKELTESSLAGWYRPVFVARDTPARVEAAAHRAWAIPDADPRWFTTTWLGLPVQVRTESEANKGLRVERWTGARGTPAELRALAKVLGELLARVHSRSERAAVAQVASQLRRDVDAFAAEQGAFAVAESAQLDADFARFGHALETLGPLLGVQQDPREQPSSTARSLFGSPP